MSEHPGLFCEDAQLRYLLSKLIPVRMRSHYMIVSTRVARGTGRPVFPEVATWWQWRGRVWAHRRDADFDYQRERNNW